MRWEFFTQVRHLRDETKHEYAKWLGLGPFFKEFYACKKEREELGLDKNENVLVAPFEEEDVVRSNIRARCSLKG